MSQGSQIKASRRRAREREARFELIRHAGARVFARAGYAGATMEAVAAEAELGKATLYHYYPTKRHLFAAIVEHATGAVDRLAMRELEPDADPIEVAASICRFSLSYFNDEPEQASLMLPLMAAGPERLRDLLGDETAAEVAATHAPLFDALSAVDARFGGDGALSSLVSSLFLGLAAKSRAGQGDSASAELELFFDLVRRHVVAKETLP